MVRLWSLLLCGVLPLLGCASVVGPETFLRDRSVGLPTAESMTVCTGDNCVERREVALTKADHERLRAFFSGTVTGPAVERERLKRAIAWLEHRVGVDSKRPPVEALNGRRMKEAFWNYHSCIDDTSNTIIFLMTLEKLGILRMHDIAAPAYRGLVLDGKVPHFTAVIREKETGTKYAVDTWLYTTGEPVIVKPLSVWLWEF